jgi:outer membrane lipoprotein SlyB
MKCPDVRTLKNRCMRLAVFTVLASVVASGDLGLAQGRGRGLGNRSPVTNRLTGTYRLNEARSDNAATMADRVTRDLPGRDQQRLRNTIMRRLEAPESLAIERDGGTITIASSQAAQVTFEANGREQIEQSRNGRRMRTMATLSGDRLVVSTEGDRSVDYQVTFQPIDNGRSLRVTRRITDESLRQPVVAMSMYDKTSDIAQLTGYSRARDNYPAVRDNSYPAAGTRRGNVLVPDGTQLVAVLNDDLSTKNARDGDRFTLTVRSPSQYAGASIDGHVARVARSGQVSGRAEMSFEFDNIRQRDGRVYPFTGYIDSVRTTNNDDVRVDNEGSVQDEGSQTERTVTRTGIGAAIGAVIGAVAGGGKGAAIGAAVGAGAGAGSVFIQGRNDLDLKNGTEFRIHASAGQ